jgi:hypothetical protein
VFDVRLSSSVTAVSPWFDARRPRVWHAVLCAGYVTKDPTDALAAIEHSFCCCSCVADVHTSTGFEVGSSAGQYAC